MKRRAIIGFCAGAALIILTVLLCSRHFRLAALAPTELTPKRPNLEAPLADDCSGIQRTLALSSQSADRGRVIRNITPLSTDEVAIYSTVIRRWVSDERTSLNISATTFPLDATSPAGILGCECLKGIQAESFLNATHSFHNLTPDVLPQKSMRLVDAKTQATIVDREDPGKTIGNGKAVEGAVTDAFASGLFSISEIAFDKEHQHALVTYSFSCGSLCGNGATLVFQKVFGEWKSTDRRCGGWVSYVLRNDDWLTSFTPAPGS